MTSLVKVSGLSKSFGAIRAVRDISFEVEKGEVLGFLGPNGAGKSTTMKMITGYLEPDAGEVRVDGSDLSSNPVAVKAAIGYLPEGAPLYGDMTTYAFLKFAGAMRGLRGADLEERVERVIDTIHLDSVRTQNLDTLSKGFKRRVGIGQAILHDPPVLILDEPTDGLDPNQKHEVRQLITSMAQRKAIILSTHILEEVEAVCSRAIIIASGTIVADGTPADLASRAGFDGAWLVEPENPGQIDALGTSLRSVAGVRSVERLDDGRTSPRLRVIVGDGEAEKALRRHLGDESVPAAQFYRQRGRLDDVFREITGGASVRT